MRRIPMLCALALALVCLAGCATTEPPADSTEPPETVSEETPAAESPDVVQKEEPEGMQTETYYDVVIGGVANDKVFNTVELYFDQLIDKSEAIRRLRYERPNLQVCFRSQHIMDTHL